MGSEEPHHEPLMTGQNEGLNKDSPQRWMVAAGVLVAAACCVAVGFIIDSSALMWLGVGVAAGGLCIALGAELTTVNLGFASFQFRHTSHGSVDGRPTTIDQSVSVIQRLSDKRIFIEAPRFFEDGEDNRSIEKMEPSEVLAGVGRSVELASPPPRADWISAPGTEVAHSGIYDIVDDHGRYLNYQRAVTTSDHRPHSSFPPLGDPRAAGYVLRKSPTHAHEDRRDIYVPGQEVPWDGIYDVVDADGKYLELQKVCVKGMHFTPLPDPAAVGYLLRDRAVDRGTT